MKKLYNVRPGNTPCFAIPYHNWAAYGFKTLKDGTMYRGLEGHKFYFYEDGSLSSTSFVVDDIMYVVSSNCIIIDEMVVLTSS